MSVPAPSTVETLLDQVRSYHSDADLDLLRRAFARAEEAHEGAVRDATGEPYILHPLRVAQMLAELRSDVPTIAAALLHDVVEDTSLDLETIKSEFGDEVAGLVDGVTKLSQAELNRRALEESADDTAPLSPDKAHEKAANIRKIFLAMARDVRVMIIKLADRLHNMQTLEGLEAPRQRRIAEETLQIFAPLAHRLGIWHFKWQLEDLAFKYLYPEEHARLADRLARTRRERESDVAEVRQSLKDRLKEAGIEAEVQGRAKHLFSIWNKLRKQELELDELYDLLAVRVIVNTVEECYHVLGIVHQLWLPIPGLFSDHIARPKPNLYQSLHTKVIGVRGEPMEVQIRTWEMHQVADYGIAAHWSYKEGARPDRRFEEKLTWLRTQMFDWQSDSSSDTDFLKAVVDDLFADQVFVFTPRGDVIDLPVGSGPIDFAFRIHTEMGLRCTGARVNGRMVSLDYRFKNGDIAEIITRSSAHPSHDWLNLVKTSHARNRIRAYFRRQRHAEHEARGRELLEKEATRQGWDLVREPLKGERLKAVASQMNYQAEADLLAGIGNGYVAPATVLNRLRAQEPPRRDVVIGRPQQPGKLTISADGMDDLLVTRGRCCQPIPGEEVVGYISRGRGITIHRLDCPQVQTAMEREPERIQSIDWKVEQGSKLAVPLTIETMDRVGVMADVSAAFRERNINIEKADIRTRPGNSAVWDIVVDVGDLEELDQVVRIVRSIPDVLDVTRPSARVERKVTSRSRKQS